MHVYTIDWICSIIQLRMYDICQSISRRYQYLIVMFYGHLNTILTIVHDQKNIIYYIFVNQMLLYYYRDSRLLPRL